VDQYALSALERLFYESENLIAYNIPLVKDDLIVGINPVVSQVDDADRLPMIGHLSATAIDDTRHFISNNKLEVLRRKLVPDK
jgi:hypothetical protein